MTTTTLPSGMLRSVHFDTKPSSGLKDGDLVVFLDPVSGKPFSAIREDLDDDTARETSVFLFGVDHDAAEVPAVTSKTLERLQSNVNTHLEVQHHREFWGFRSSVAENRLLQATRKGACRMRFHGENFGTWEEWLLDARYVERVMNSKWTQTEVVFRHRRLEKLELKVTVVRLGACTYDDSNVISKSISSTPMQLSHRGTTDPSQSLPQSAYSSRYNSPVTHGSVRPPLSRPMPGTGAEGTRADVTKEHTSVLHAMSGAVAKEFVVALQREVATRAALEREVQEMHAASEELRSWTLTELERLRKYGQDRVDEIANDTLEARDVALTAHKASRGTERAVAAAFARRRKRVATQKAFGAFKEHADAEARTKRLLLRAASRMQQRCVSGAFDRWFDVTTERKRARITAAKHMTRWRNASVSSAFSAWRALWRRSAMRNGAVRVMTARARVTTLAPAVRKWRSAVSKRKSMSASERKAEAKFEFLLRRALGNSFHQWFDLTQNQKVKRRRITSATARMALRRAQRTQREGLNAWSSVAHRSIDVRRAVSRENARFGRNIRNSCFSKWKFFTDSNVGLRKLAMRTFALTESAKQSTTFRAWRHLVSEKKRATQVKLTKVLTSWTRRGVSKAFNAWCDTWQTQKRQRALLHRIGIRLRSRHVSLAFAKWFDLTSDAKTARVLISKISTRIQRREVASAFAAWAYFLDETKRITVLLGKALGRMQSQQIAMAFGRWVEKVEDSQMEVHNLNKAVKHSVNSSTRCFFVAWKYDASHASRQRKLTKRALMKFTHRHLSSSFETWRSTTQFNKRARGVVQRVLERWKRRALVASFDSWRSETVEAKQYRHKLQIFFNRYSRLTLSSAFDGWVEGVVKLRRSRVLLTKAVSKWQRGVLSSAFDTWFDAMTKTRARRVKMATVVKRWTSRDLSKAFTRWQRLHQIETEGRSVLVKASVVRLLGRRRGDAFRGWKRRVSDIKSARKKVGVVIERWTRLKVSSAFDGWRTSVANKIRKRYITHAAVGRWTHQMVGGAFGAWLDAMLSTRLSTELANRAIRKLTNRTLLAAFNAWVRNSELSMIHTQKLQIIIQRWRSRDVASSFDRWYDFLTEQKRLRVLALKVVRRIKKMELASAFETWCTSVETSRKLTGIVNRILQRTTATAFNTWVDGVDNANKQKVVLSRVEGMASKLSARLKSSTFREWHQLQKKQKHGMTLCRNMLARVYRANKRDAWEQWSAEVKHTKDERDNLKKCLTRKRVAQRWFLRWYWDAFDSDIQVALANILGASENAMDGAGLGGSGLGGSGMPSAIRGVRPVQRRNSSSSEDSDSDEDMTRVGVQNAADALLFGAKAFHGNDESDVKHAARVLAAQIVKSPYASEAYQSISDDTSSDEYSESASPYNSLQKYQQGSSREIPAPVESYESRMARAVREKEMKGV